ncbi:MAG: Na(+)-translocating NADH-quinone reductase subunit A [Muribaculaceae bacterium]|nr:Na(+)-translocating NADH-quinone reductase subunit A [Muribaculaceae bacterium]
MSIGIKVKKGLDLHLEGAVADPRHIASRPTATVAVTPDDFVGLVPKMDVREGDSVKAGQPLFHDKTHPEIKVVSPAAGTVKAVVRGERRKIIRVIIEVGSGDSVKLSTEGVLSDSAKARNLLLESGLWAMTTQRPYAIVTDPDAELRDIFVSGFDSAPLAENITSLTDEQRRSLEAGVSLLGLLTKGKVYVSRRDASAIPDIKGAEMVDVAGPHPSGNAGTLIAAIRPVNKGETVMCLDLPTLLRIGATVLTGIVPSTTIVAVTGSEVKEPEMVECHIGAEISAVLNGNIKSDGRNHRIISGNVLTGVAVGKDDYLRFPYRQITVIPEGDDVDEFMGWASLSPSKMSLSPSFPGHFLRRKLFRPDARLQGGRRAMIMSGEYDKVMPMDILPEYLIKAILSRDIDRMEQLGIYEVAPEDFALAEYADTSKLELQKIVREGLDYMRKELE